MKVRLLFTLFFAALAGIVLTANRNGRATVSGAGNTGAPGDEANANGTPRTCGYCHFNGAIQSATTISVLDSAGTAVTDYVPGQSYTVRVAISTLAGNPQRYGFQMIGLRNTGNTDLDGFSDSGNTNNYKLATIANGRTYAEQNTASTTPSFDVAWTAPPAGTGAITFYASGNAVNNNQLSTGDGPSNTSLALSEAQSSAIVEPAGPAMRVFPTVLAASERRLRIAAEAPGNYRLQLVDLTGRVHWQTTATLSAGVNVIAVPAGEWPAGIYLLAIEGRGSRTVVRIVRS